MWQDPIVKETRELREQYADQFDHDADAIFEDILRRQRSSRKQLVSYPARKPTPTQHTAQQVHSADAPKARAADA